MSSSRGVRRAYGLIRSALRDDAFRGERLTEDLLETETGTSRTEVREVLAQLAEEGILSRRQRVGTVLESDIVPIAVDQATAYTAKPADRYAQRVLQQYTVESSGLLRERLGDGEVFLVADTVIELNGIPLAFRTTYWRGDEARRDSPVGQAGQDMRSSFLAAFGVPLGRCVAAIESVRPSERLRRALGLSGEAAVLLREAVLLDVHGRPHELSYTYYAGNRVALRMDTDYTVAPSTLG